MNPISGRQWNMLKLFASRGSGWHADVDAARKFDQRPFRSMLVRGYIAYRRNRGFHITGEGMKAWEEFSHTKILRANPYAPLTKYFDPGAYGLHIVTAKEKKKAA